MKFSESFKRTHIIFVIFLIIQTFFNIYIGATTYDTTASGRTEFQKCLDFRETVTLNAYERLVGNIKLHNGIYVTGDNVFVQLDIPIEGPLMLNGRRITTSGDLFLGDRCDIYDGQVYGGGVITWHYIKEAFRQPGGGLCDGAYFEPRSAKDSATLHLLRNTIFHNSDFIFCPIQIDGHGHSLSFVGGREGLYMWYNYISLKNLIFNGNIADASSALLHFDNVVLDISSIPNGHLLLQGGSAIFINNDVKIVAQPGNLFTANSAIYINKNSTLNLSKNVTFHTFQGQGGHGRVYFGNRQSTLILENCTLKLGSMDDNTDGGGYPLHAYLQTALTLTGGTIIVDGTVNAVTPKTYAATFGHSGCWLNYFGPLPLPHGCGYDGQEMPAGFDLILGGSTPDEEMNVIFNPNSYLVASDAVNLKIY